MGNDIMIELVALGLAGCCLVLLAVVMDMFRTEPDPDVYPDAYPADYPVGYYSYTAGVDTAPTTSRDD